MGNPFSRRHGFRPRREIAVREDAPEAVRAGLVGILTDMGLSYSDIRSVVRPVLHVFPDQNNWSEVPNIRDEVIGLIQGCDWYRVYDIAEASYVSLATRNREEEFEQHLNELFEELGIGWQMVNGQVVTRGDQEVERAVAHAGMQIEATGLRNAKIEIESPRRPEQATTTRHHGNHAALYGSVGVRGSPRIQ